MKKMIKYLSFESLKLQLEQSQPKQVARAILSLKDPQVSKDLISPISPARLYKTSKYGEVSPSSKVIEWSNIIEIPYINQEMFIVETVCEHQYGYEIDELEAMFHGEIYIKTENFFRPLTIHVYNKHGVKCGILKYIIKVIEREANKAVKNKQEEVQFETIKLELIGRISLFSAQFQPSAPTFKKDKYLNNFSIDVILCGKNVEGIYKKNFQWSFINAKVQFMENNNHWIIVELKQEGELVLKGEIGMNGIIENRRFVTHSITMYSATTQAKIGVLKLDLRFITKQELLDLMYSPNKLAKNKDEKELGKYGSESNFQKSRINSSSLIQSSRKISLNSARGSMNSNSQLPNIENMESNYRLPNRYKKVHVTNGYNQIIFSKAKRFIEPKHINPNISYSDPQQFSDFSPDNKNGYRHVKGADISITRKMDFTKQYQNNPGVGQYKLPSIWDKY